MREAMMRFQGLLTLSLSDAAVIQLEISRSVQEIASAVDALDTHAIGEEYAGNVLVMKSWSLLIIKFVCHILSLLYPESLQNMVYEMSQSIDDMEAFKKHLLDYSNPIQLRKVNQVIVQYESAISKCKFHARSL